MPSLPFTVRLQTEKKRDGVQDLACFNEIAAREHLHEGYLPRIGSSLCYNALRLGCNMLPNVRWEFDGGVS